MARLQLAESTLEFYSIAPANSTITEHKSATRLTRTKAAF
jgi:hypothetical protein